MKRTASVVVLALVAFSLSPALGQTQFPVTVQSTGPAIQGFGMYVLGTPMAIVLRNDPALTPGSHVIYSSKVPGGIAYSRTFTAPLGGYDYPARLALIFWHDRLAAIIVEWGTLAFPSVDDWRAAGAALYQQLRANYPADMITGDYPPAMLELRDVNGNQLHGFAARRDFSVNLDYVAADYANAVAVAPNPTIKY